MTWLEAVFLALIQGLTEFLPISSSAHLILPSQILGWEDQGLAFDVAVHVGTLLAIVLYFRKDVLSLLTAWFGSVFKRQHTEESRLAWLIIFATVPAGLTGVLANDFIDQNLRSSIVIATTTILFGLLLWYADKRGSLMKPLSRIDLKSALLVGVGQALALIPGTSRSGITMTVALLLGYSRNAAARFSFLLSIPLIAAAGMLKTKELIETGSDSQWNLIVIGTAVAFVSAYACIHWFLKLLDKIGFTPFVVYRLLLGTVLFILYFLSY